ANCVVHQEGPFRITARPGKYRIEAAYRPGNTPLGLVGGPVVDLEVLPGPSGVGSTNSAAGDANTADADTDLVGLLPTEPHPGGGGTDPDPCVTNPEILCPIGPGESCPPETGVSRAQPPGAPLAAA